MMGSVLIEALQRVEVKKEILRTLLISSCFSIFYLPLLFFLFPSLTKKEVKMLKTFVPLFLRGIEEQ